MFPKAETHGKSAEKTEDHKKKGCQGKSIGNRHHWVHNPKLHLDTNPGRSPDEDCNNIECHIFHNFTFLHKCVLPSPGLAMFKPHWPVVLLPNYQASQLPIWILLKSMPHLIASNFDIDHLLRKLCQVQW